MWFVVGNSQCTRNYGYPRIEHVRAEFFYDVNGDKKPNTLGKDVFLYLFDIDGVYPYILNSGNCANKNGAGWSCSGYIIKHNNMNYLH